MKVLKLIEVKEQPGNIAPNGLTDGFYYFDKQVYQCLGGIAWVVIIHPDNLVTDNEPEEIKLEGLKLVPTPDATVSESFALKALALALKRPVDTLKILNEGR